MYELFVELAHALFALPTMMLSRRGWRSGLCGLALGMLLHGISNAPIVLMQRDVFGWKRETWGLIIQLWLALITAVGLVALLGAVAGRKIIRKLWANRMICPECGGIYRQPIVLGLNFGMSRYEPCGLCHKWHWVTLKNLAPLKRK